MYHDDLVLLHIDGPTNPVDVGTKRDRTEKAQVVLSRRTEQGRYHPAASKDFDKTFGSLTAISEEMREDFEVWPVLMKLDPTLFQSRLPRGD